MKAAWAIFISGRGGNLRALTDLKDEVDLRVVVSSKANVLGLGRARREGLPIEVLPAKIDWNQVDELLKTYKVSHIFLLGFMKIVPAPFISQWQGNIINLHPSLLPSYPGLKSIERAYRDGSDMGISLHHVVPEVDAGPLIAQQRVLSAEELSTKNLTLEQAEFLIHVSENSMVREAIRNWV